MAIKTEPANLEELLAQISEGNGNHVEPSARENTTRRMSRGCAYFGVVANCWGGWHASDL